MDNTQLVTIVCLIIASLIIFFVSICWYSGSIIKKRRSPEKYYKIGISTTIIFSCFVVLALWVLRIAVGYYNIIFPAPDSESLSVPEEIINSLFGTFRTFGMEEEYAGYILNIKNLVAAIIPNDHWSYPVVQALTVAYASILNILAPVLGGAIVLEILSSVFPKVRLFLSYYVFGFKRKKYFFSELSAASLALAKSISVMKKDEKPVIIFTDTYTDDENEKEYELLLEAKRYGAICVRDDLAHVAKPCCGKREYYLMDENEFSNLQTLMGLVEDNNLSFIKNSNIYMFVQSDAYVQIEKQVNLKLNNPGNKKALKPEENPVIIPVRGFRNLVHNLFVDIPLFEPLIGKTDPTKLNITILGNGVIGTEAFLSAYWFGQMMISRKENSKDNGEVVMSECNMTINVVSKDTKEAFWSNIDYINPEIQKTVNVIEGSEKRCADELLVYNGSGAKNKAYCDVRYIESDVKIGGFWNSESAETQQLIDSDYFIVALGNDADNISIAEKLRRSVGKRHLETKADECNNTVIAYAVFDSEIAGILNEHKRYQTRGNGKTDIYMYAFGSLEQVYSCDNIYMSKNSVFAEEAGNAYLKAYLESSHLSENKKRAKENENSDYYYWANLAKASFLKYRVFSLGWIYRSVFSYYGDTMKCQIDKTKHGVERYEFLSENTDEEPYSTVSADAYHREFTEQLCGKYKRIAITNSAVFSDTEDQKLKDDLELKKHVLAWMEHRRWNAFTRTMGYQHTEVNNIFEVKKAQKDMSLKLHSCLVEARLPSVGKDDTYIYAEFKPNGKVNMDTAFKLYETMPLDRLDEVSKRRKNVDCKTYDYYRYDFDDYLSTEEASKLLNVDKKTLACNCEKGKLEGAIRFKDFSEWYIPYEMLKAKIEKKYRKLDPEKDMALIAECKKGLRNDAFELFDYWFISVEQE